MEDIKLKLLSLCAFNIKENPLIKAFISTDEATPDDKIKAYSLIMNTLLDESQTLSQYLRDLLLFSDSPVLLKAAYDPTPFRTACVEHDVEIIRELSEVNTEQLFASKACIGFPVYENGEFNFTADFFIELARLHRTGPYAKDRAFLYSDERLEPIEKTDPITLSMLKRYEVQRKQLVDNTEYFLKGLPAANALLYGDRGTGKSSTIKAIFNEYQDLRIIQLPRNEIPNLLKLYNRLEKLPHKFIIMLDDISFSESDDGYNALKAALEGALLSKPDNILIYATTNRRHILKETQSGRDGGDISRADAIDEGMSLADRFGLFITFTKPDKLAFLDIVEQIAAERGISPTQEFLDKAERFAIKKAGRSPRIARQFVDMYESAKAVSEEE